MRKATYTYQSIVDRKAFTVSIPSEDHVRQADYFGLVSGRDADKFAASGLTAVRSEVVDAPYVTEFPLILECRLVQTIELGLHTQFIGEVIDTKLDEAVLNAGGEADILRIKPFLYATGTKEYHGVGAFIGKAFSAGRER